MAPPRSAGKSRISFTDVLLVRLVNALSIATFFQPDEYFQSLEPAWNLAFGSDSGAWLTWVCPYSLPQAPSLALTNCLGMALSAALLAASHALCHSLLTR